MIDVHRWILRPPRHRAIDEPLEGALFVLDRQRPPAGIGWLLALILTHDAEEVLSPEEAYEWIAFEIKKHVTGRGLRQAAQSATIDNVEQFKNRLALRPSANLY